MYTSLKDRSDATKFTASLMKQVYLERCLEDNELCLGCGLKLLRGCSLLERTSCRALGEYLCLLGGGWLLPEAEADDMCPTGVRDR